MKPMLKQAHLQTAQCRLTDQSLQKSLLCQRTVADQMSGQSAYRQEGRTANTGLAKVAVQYSADTFVVNQSLVLRINICGENRHLRQAQKRYASP
jgi:hypothetical protein